ncbi:hypothetical protein AAVH_21644 [Aphelenchoides avenae]|nr:hypothetical protein AAVH_21644 [Aphelenchus avenae]
MHFSKHIAKVFRRQSYQFESPSLPTDVALSCCTLKSIRRLCNATHSATADGNISPAYNKSSSEQSLFGSRFTESDDAHLLFVLHFLKRLELDICLIVCGHWKDAVELHAFELPLHKLDVLQIYDESITVCQRKLITHMLSVRLCRDDGQCAYGEKTISRPHLHEMLTDWKSLFRNSFVGNLIFTSHKPIDDSILLGWQALLAEVSKIDVNCSLGEIQTDCEEWGAISPEVFTSYLLSTSLKDVNVSKVFSDTPCTFLNVFLGNTKIRRSSSVRIAFDIGVPFHASQLLLDYVFAAKDAKNRDLFELSPWTADPYFASAFTKNFRSSEDTSHIPRIVRLHCVDESVGIEDIWPDADQVESGSYYQGRVFYDAPPAFDGSKLVVVFEGWEPVSGTSDRTLK